MQRPKGNASVMLDTVHAFSFSEEERYTPDTRKGYQSVDDTFDRAVTAAQPLYSVETEKADASPIQRADNG